MTNHLGLEDLNLTGEEAECLTNAFKEEGFRTLFAEYVAELNDPEQRAIYEVEVIAMERQRGVEARFLHPTPGWVLRTSQGGSRRCYINICSNRLIGRPEFRPEPGGSCWLLPHSLAPGREELSRKQPRGPRRLVYDVVFHPRTLSLAGRMTQFRRLVNDTALEAIEKNFSPQLDRTNAVPLNRIKYKGVPQATLLRTPLAAGARPSPEEAGEPDDSPLPPFPSPYTYPPPSPQYEAPRPPPPKQPPSATTPQWSLRHRSYVDLQDYRNSRDSTPSPIPRELVMTIELPLLSSAAQAQLEILGQELQLDSQRPAAYHLRVPLPYAVDESRGRATFNKAKKQLVVVLPVSRKPDPGFPFSVQAAEEQIEASPENEEQLPEDSCISPDKDGAEVCQKTSCSEQPLPVLASDVEITPTPSLAVAATNDAVDAALLSDLNGPVPLSAHERPRRNNLEFSMHAGEEHPVVSCASEFSAALPVCSENNSEGDPDLTRSSNNVILGAQPEGTGLDSLSTSLHTDHTWKLHTDPAVSLNQEHLCTDMELNKNPNIANVELPLCPDNSTIPCKWPSDSLDHSETILSTDNLDQSTEFSGNSDTANPTTTNHVEHSVLYPGKRPTVSSVQSSQKLEVAVDTHITSTCIPDPSISPASALCPPFNCTQDEKSLVILLQVPDIVPLSFQGEVGTNYYSVNFANRDSISYSFLLQFLPENKLSSPESEVNVSPNNVVIILTKSPETTGIWTKFYFGSNYATLQERWFITENNVDKFVSHPGMCCSSQSEKEHKPLIEVLGVSEGKSQIRLKQIENGSLELGRREKREGSEQEQEDGKLLTDEENSSEQTKSVSGSFVAMQAMGQVGKGSSYCMELDPGDPSGRILGKLQINKLHESGLTFATSKRATSSVQAELQEGEEVNEQKKSSQNKELNRLAPTVLKETNMQDGSVEYTSCHRTQCAATFENALLYELD
ncbi:protein kintoun isoform X1 [Pantherophis guttatus]|uniref:Protein kintoun n=1 Tax=Pantherophis guttatus TaxID=94885 RepID=A0A6P9D0H8_PANGU|nr:protein kintoun isoform X1 [Pantherophis guttatus]